MLKKVISGGQTGADLAGLYTASIYRIPTGGFCPKGFRTVIGPNPELGSRYGLVETITTNYHSRTVRNVRIAGATLRLASDFNTPGESLTLRACKEFNKPYCDIRLDEQNYQNKALRIMEFMKEYGVEILNVAGNSDKEGLNGYHFKEAVIVLSLVFQKYAR